MTEKNIIDKFCEEYLNISHSSDRIFPNIFYKDYECDILKLTKSGLLYEYEVKISRNDFKNDKLKKKRYVNENGHWIFNKETKHDEISAGKRINYFSYVVPMDLIGVDDIPEWCGLIYVGENIIDGRSYLFLRTVKKPKRLTSSKITLDETLFLYKSIYYRYHRLRLKQNQIHEDT